MLIFRSSFYIGANCDMHASDLGLGALAVLKLESKCILSLDFLLRAHFRSSCPRLHIQQRFKTHRIAIRSIWHSRNEACGRAMRGACPLPVSHKYLGKSWVRRRRARRVQLWRVVAESRSNQREMSDEAKTLKRTIGHLALRVVQSRGRTPYATKRKCRTSVSSFRPRIYSSHGTIPRKFPF